jgi:hypothetical protein
MGLSRSQNVAPVLGFLGRVFIDANASGLPVSPLVSEHDDELFALNQRSRNERFPRPARDYLDEWAAPERGYGRSVRLDQERIRFSLVRQALEPCASQRSRS